jgi:signal recognition particle GTPase
VFESLSDKLQSVFGQLASQGKLSEGDVNNALREVRLALLEADVNYKVVKEFVNRIKERAIGVEVMNSLTPAQQVVKIVNEELIELLGKPAPLNLSGQPSTIMLVGLQGAGKTTTAAKLALRLRNRANVRSWWRRISTAPPLSASWKYWVSRSTFPSTAKGHRSPPPRLRAMRCGWRVKKPIPW